MHSHIRPARSGAEAAQADATVGPDGAPGTAAARDAAQADGGVLQILRARIGGGGAELKGAAGGGPQPGRPAGTAAGTGTALSRTVSGAVSGRGGVAGLSASTSSGAGPATATSLLPGFTGNGSTGDDATSGILRDEGGAMAEPEPAATAAADDALPLVPDPLPGALRAPGAGNVPALAGAQENPFVASPGEGVQGGDVGADGAMRAPSVPALADTRAFAGMTAPADPLAGAGTADASAANAVPTSRDAASPAPTATPAVTTTTIATTTRPPSASPIPAGQRGSAIAPPARSTRDVIADAVGTAGRYASTTARRAGTLASAAGRTLAERGAALPGVRALEAGLAERGWTARHGRSSDAPADIDTGVGADTNDPSSVASGNEAAGVVSVVRFAVQAREWLDERRLRAPAHGCPHRRSLRCRWYCRAGCTRRGV
ncbi:hypothetical protein LGM65_30880 [Burkholderia anthina]|uniref:hypothetical protein n=1 Tax=Burkholderia anthina TaxID=179879 RepID=UPI001CF41AFD|nr:hypothetical protein [Burkholderia anthina]MCA8095228.1 hypothetical protein [Burkholderia anthina]